MLRMLRSVNSKVASLYQYFNLIFGTTAYQNIQPSDHAINTANAIFELLEIRRQCLPGVIEEEDGETLTNLDEPAAWTKVKGYLRECSELESLCQVIDDDGYNVLLMAVLQNDTEVLELLVSEGCSLNISKCTLPLHLACRLGNLRMVQYLISHGSSPDIEAGMCYPKHHAPIMHVPSRFHFLETDIFACDSNYHLPLMYAIEDDHLDVAKFLLERRAGPKDKWPYNRHPLHHACECGAFDCMEYLARKRLDQIIVADDEGLTPLLHAVKWGKKFVKFLVEAEADVHGVNFKQQNALHLLYSNVKHPLELYPTTKFLLGTGMELDVNRIDFQGNSPLHAVISQLNHLVSSFPDNPETVQVNDQLKFDKQVLDCLEMLLSFNCDPNLVNGSGVTALHKVVLMLDFVISNDPNGITLETLPAREKYKVDFNVVHKAMEILLRHGAQPDKTTAAGRTVLIILLHMVLTINHTGIPVYRSGIMKCLSLLCESGACPSRTLVSHINIVTLLSKIGHKCLLIRQPALQESMSKLFQDILALLLKHGLESNHCSKRKQPAIEGASGNILLELVKLAQYIRQPSDLLLIHDWVLTLLQFGANPDIEPYPTDPIICHSQSSIFLKPKGSQAVNQYMYEIQDFNQIFEGGYARKLLMLFYNSMDHEALYQCMSTVKFLSHFDPNQAPTGKFLELINSLSSQPRSLKQIARVAIYKSLDRQLNLRVRHLPLPKSVKDDLVCVA